MSNSNANNHCGMPDPFIRYLAATDFIDGDHPEVQRLAQQLKSPTGESVETARRCFEWVRDEIRHSSDFQQNPVTCAASEVLEHRTGYCYAKSHLLAALVRANGIPAGLCYQRLCVDETAKQFCLHGLNAVHLPDVGWYRVDARGNRDDVHADFSPPTEHLAFDAKLPGERDLPEIWDRPLPVVVDSLRAATTWDQMLQQLPDVEVIDGRSGSSFL